MDKKNPTNVKIRRSSSNIGTDSKARKNINLATSLEKDSTYNNNSISIYFKKL